MLYGCSGLGTCIDYLGKWWTSTGSSTMLCHFVCWSKRLVFHMSAIIIPHLVFVYQSKQNDKQRLNEESSFQVQLKFLPYCSQVFCGTVYLAWILLWFYKISYLLYFYINFEANFRKFFVIPPMQTLFWICIAPFSRHELCEECCFVADWRINNMAD